MLNQIALIGRLTKVPEIKLVGKDQNSVVRFILAVNRPKYGDSKPQADFIPVVAWRGTADFVSKYFANGRMAVVSGRLQIRNWQDKEGNKRRSAEVVADNVYFGESKKDSQSSNSTQSNEPAQSTDFAPLDDDDSDLPF